MHDAQPLILTLVGGLVLAFIFGMAAHRLKLPALAGYLLAGVVAGPFTPGYVADAHLAQELAELGVILLMFGVGLHFSLKDLLEVKAVAIPGALVQMAATTVMGMVLGWALDWPLAQGFVFGLALSVASTVVLLRALEERHLFETTRGRIAVGWLIVEDLAMVLALVLLPALASVGSPEQAESSRSLWVTIAITLGKVGLFVALMLATVTSYLFAMAPNVSPRRTWWYTIRTRFSGGNAATRSVNFSSQLTGTSKSKGPSGSVTQWLNAGLSANSSSLGSSASSEATCKSICAATSTLAK